MAFSLEHAQQLLQTARRNKRMPHALLLTGTESAGTHSLALHLAAQLNNAHAESLDALRHPMIQLVRPSSKSRSILIEDIRTVEPFLSLRAEPGATKLVIILDADRMKIEAANAFLKTLEEPPDQTLIILITEQPDHLLPTILSRCIRMDLRSKDKTLRLSEVQELFLPYLCQALPKMGSDVIAMGLGRDFQAILSERKDENAKRLSAALKAEAKAISEGTDIRDWENRNKDATTALVETEYLGEREQLLELFSLALGQAVMLASNAPDLIPLAPEIAELGQRISVHELLRRMESVDALRNDLKYNVSEALTLDVRLLEIIGNSLIES